MSLHESVNRLPEWRLHICSSKYEGDAIQSKKPAEASFSKYGWGARIRTWVCWYQKPEPCDPIIMSDVL